MNFHTGVRQAELLRLLIPEAMTSERCYRKNINLNAAFTEMEQISGS